MDPFSMQPSDTQQSYGQYLSTLSGNPGSEHTSHHGVTDRDITTPQPTPGFVQTVAPSHNAQPQAYTTGNVYTYQPAMHTGPGCGNDPVYGGGLKPGYGSYHAMPRSSNVNQETPAHQPLPNSDYSTEDVYTYQPAMRTGPGCDNNAAYGGGSIPGYGTYHAMSGSSNVTQGTPAHQPLPNSHYSMEDVYTYYQPAMRTGPGCGNDATYGGGSIPDYGSYHAMPGSSNVTQGAPAIQPLPNSDHSTSSTSYYRQDKPYYAGHHSDGTAQVPAGPSPLNFSPHLPEADPQQLEDAWRFRTCWVSHAKGDEIHVTISLKKT